MTDDSPRESLSEQKRDSREPRPQRRAGEGVALAGMPEGFKQSRRAEWQTSNESKVGKEKQGVPETKDNAQ